MPANTKHRRPAPKTVAEAPLTPHQLKMKRYSSLIESDDFRSNSTEVERVALGACLEMLQNENGFGTPFEKLLHNLIWGYISDRKILSEVAREAFDSFESDLGYIRDISESFSRRYTDREEDAVDA